MNRSLVLLRTKLVRLFSLAEIEDICFQLNIDPENIEGDAKIDRARNLLLYLERLNRLDDLENICREMRPSIWESLDPLQTASESTQKKTPADAEVLSKRRAAYEALFRILKPFARYDKSQELDKTQLKEVSEGMRDWYFDMGGLYLTDDCRAPYFSLKDILKSTIEISASEKIEPNALISAASRLRAFLREDID